MKRTALLVMAKSPEPGKVKTRLTSAMSAEQACAVYRSLLLHAVGQFHALSTIKVHYFISGDLALFSQATGIQQANLHAQVQGDLGVKMSSAIQSIFDPSSPSKLLVVGTDCPFIDHAYLQQAVSALDDHDCVVGPASDGGYVLIGMTRPQPALFNSIEWGSDRVLAQTLSNMGERSYHLLPVLHDIDHPHDLVHLRDIDALSHWSNLS